MSEPFTDLLHGMADHYRRVSEATSRTAEVAAESAAIFEGKAAVGPEHMDAELALLILELRNKDLATAREFSRLADRWEALIPEDYR